MSTDLSAAPLADDLAPPPAFGKPRRGTEGDDTIGGNGRELFGEGGNDLLYARPDRPTSETMYGGSGDDRLISGDGPDQLFGDSGGDSLNGGDGSDLLVGGGGVDAVFAGVGHDTVYGGDGRDALNGSHGDDILFGGKGADTLSGGGDFSGLDRLTGGTGRDQFVLSFPLYGGTSWVAVSDLTEEDEVVLPFFSANTTVMVEYVDGDSVLTFSNPKSEEDQIVFFRDVTITGEIDAEQDGTLTILGADLLGGVERAPRAAPVAPDDEPSDDADKIKGTDDDDTISALDGDDTIEGAIGDDELYGNAGDDSISGGTGKDVLSGGTENDHVSGGTNEDLIYGGTGDDFLYGDASADTIRGGDDWDLINGGAGDDLLYGGGRRRPAEWRVGRRHDLWRDEPGFARGSGRRRPAFRRTGRRYPDRRRREQHARRG